MVDLTKTLADLPPGSAGIVRSLQGGRHFRGRLASLGFTEGALIKVVQNYGRGPMLVSLRGALVALGRAEGGQVWVDAASDR